MSDKETTALLELITIGLIVVIAAALFWDSLGLPESLREPLGSASIPRIVCGLVVLFCGILLTRSVKVISSERAKRAHETQASPPATGVNEVKLPFRRRGDLAVKVLLIAVAYVTLIQTHWISSKILTPVFLGGAVLVLNDFRRSAVIPAIIIALVIGLGTNFLFTDFFYVDLP